MKPILNRVSLWLLYSNLFIGLCAYAMIGVTFHAFPLIVNSTLERYPLILLFATIGFYAIHRSFGSKPVEPESESEYRFRFIEKNRCVLAYLGWAFLLLSLITAIVLIPFRYLLLLLPASLVTIFYVLPLLPGKKRLRDFPFVKILLIASIWAYVTAYIPMVDQNLNWQIKIMYFIDRLLFIFAITIPFDIRDMKLDLEKKTQTIPLVLGITSSKFIAICSLAIGTTMIGLLAMNGAINYSYLYTTIGVYIIAGIFIWYADNDQKDYYYTGFIDGIMILYFLVLLLLSWV